MQAGHELEAIYVPEGERVHYGLTKNIHTYNPVRAAFHEYVAMWHDIRRAHGTRAKLGVLYHGPGWVPPGIPSTEMESNTRG